MNAQLLEWLEEPEPEMLFAKPEDGDVEGALAIQSRINESQLIDLDADWGDVEIHFLTVRKGRVSLSGLDEGFLRHVSGMLAYGLEAGTVSGSWVQEACAAYEGDFEFDEVELRVRLLLGELGIVDEEWFWEEGATACPDGDPEDLSEDVLGFLSCLGRNHFQELDSFYQSLRECHLLSEEEERAAGQQWVDHGEIAGIQKLVQGNVRFVVQEARRFLHGPLEFGDILGEGVLGLYEASRRYDPSRGNRFLTYAAWWVRQSIFRALSNVGDGVRFPSKLGSAIARYRWYSSKVKDRFGYQVEAADLARDGLFPIAEAKFLQRMHESTEVVPLEECSYERWALPESEIEEHAEAEESKALEVRSALWSLSEREQLILAHHFGLSGMREKTLEEIGQIMTPPVSRERVRQIEVRALESVRTRYPNLRQMLCEFTPFTWVPNLVDCGQEVEDDAE